MNCRKSGIITGLPDAYGQTEGVFATAKNGGQGHERTLG
jgi:hypothetical protein